MVPPAGFEPALLPPESAFRDVEDRWKVGIDPEFAGLHVFVFVDRHRPFSVLMCTRCVLAKIISLRQISNAVEVGSRATCRAKLGRSSGRAWSGIAIGQLGSVTHLMIDRKSTTRTSRRRRARQPGLCHHDRPVRRSQVVEDASVAPPSAPYPRPHGRIIVRRQELHASTTANTHSVLSTPLEF
jgi:hypothetical protein